MPAHRIPQGPGLHLVLGFLGGRLTLGPFQLGLQDSGLLGKEWQKTHHDGSFIKQSPLCENSWHWVRNHGSGREGCCHEELTTKQLFLKTLVALLSVHLDFVSNIRVTLESATHGCALEFTCFFVNI